MILQANLVPNRVFWYVAPTIEQAKRIVWNDPQMLNHFLPREVVAKRNESERTITFTNGSKLHVLGADNPDSLRGAFPFGVIIDEFAQVKREVWDEIILPIVGAQKPAKVEIKGKDVTIDPFYWIVGTPKATGAYFKELHDKAKHDPNWYSLTLKSSESGILDESMLEMIKGQMTEVGYQQEYECEWHTEGGVVFRGVDNIIYGTYKEPHQKQRRQWGLDLALHEDWTVLCGINRQTHELDVFDRYNKVDWNLQKARIESLVRRLGVDGDRINADATGVGEPIVQDLHRVGMNVNGVKFTNQVKADLVKNLMLGIEQRKLLIPDIPELIQELKIFGYEITKAGNVRYSAPEGFHDDCVMSLALAWYEIGSKLGESGKAERILSKQGLPNELLLGGSGDTSSELGDYE